MYSLLVDQKLHAFNKLATRPPFSSGFLDIMQIKVRDVRAENRMCVLGGGGESKRRRQHIAFFS